MNKEKINKEEKIRLARKKVEKLKESILAIGFQVEVEEEEIKLKS